jgi:uncharacterized protein (TIGR03435 family)
MQRRNRVFESHRKPLPGAVGFFTLSVLIIAVLGNGTPIRAQSQMQKPATAASEFKYDVVSIKLHKSGDDRQFGSETIDGFSDTNTDLLSLILDAYGPLDPAYFPEVVAMIPKSLADKKYDIEAKMDSSEVEAFRKLSQQDRLLARQRMMQALLADRFKMAVHFETREVPVYWLVVSKPGKLHEAGGACGSPPAKPEPKDDQTMPCGHSTSYPGYLRGQQIPIEEVARRLSDRVHRAVVDKTGLTGKYDIDLKWSADDAEFPGGVRASDSNFPTPDPNGPSLFAAIQEQLGLKLVPNKGQAQVLIIDHLEAPSGN